MPGIGAISGAMQQAIAARPELANLSPSQKEGLVAEQVASYASNIGQPLAQKGFDLAKQGTKKGLDNAFGGSQNG